MCQYTNGRNPSGLELVNLGVGMPRTWTLRLQSISWSSFYLLERHPPSPLFHFRWTANLPYLGLVTSGVPLTYKNSAQGIAKVTRPATVHGRLVWHLLRQNHPSPHVSTSTISLQRFWCTLLEEIDFHFSWHKKFKKLRTMQHRTIIYHTMQWQPLLDEPDDLS